MIAPIRVVHADDQDLLREGLGMVLALLPGVEVVGVASDGEEALALAGRLLPDVVLMDLRMPRCDGVEATRRLRERNPEINVIMITTSPDDGSVVAALQAGARGYLIKDCGAAELQHALEQVVNGEVMIDPAVEHQLLDAAPVTGEEPVAPRQQVLLSTREIQVLSAVAEGLTNAAISDQLLISEAMVQLHLNRVMRKIGASRRAQAVHYACRHGLGSDTSSPRED
jgi:DNA-binding NarL/FixJ family response regulator